jgi:hypothetical protein
MIDSFEVSALSDNEAAKTGEEKAKDLLRSGRLVFLQTVGYTKTHISGLGDLAAVSSERMTELLHGKAEEAIANALGESLQKYHLRLRRLGGSKRKRK